MKIDADRLREMMTPDWTDDRHEAVRRRLNAPEPRPGRRGVVAGALLAAAVLIGVVSWRAWSPAPTAEAPPTHTTRAEPSPAARRAVGAAPLKFGDGTIVVPHDASSEVLVAGMSEAQTSVVLRSGGARFDVTPNPRRRFRVEAGPVLVEVLGTEFDCERRGDQVKVNVLRGRVRVSWPGGERELAAGEEGTFPRDGVSVPSTIAQEPAADVVPLEPPSPPEASNAADVPADAADSKAPARARPRPPSAETLMRNADRARKSGDVATALESLRRVLEVHPKDSRAPLAAFTLGRIEQGRRHHAAAARYFAKVRRLGKSSLREHALAREAEAWASAGEDGKAMARAREYLDRYPTGPRAAQVRALAGEASP